MKLALITGASAGIGKLIAYHFAEDGINLAIVARREDKLQEVKKEIEDKYTIDVLIIVADLASAEGPTSVFEKLKDHEVTHLVNNAGFGTNGIFWEMDRKTELQQIGLNIAALTELTHLFLPQMVKRNAGHVLNIASTAAFQPGPYMSVYYATKAYVLAFSEGLSGELSETNVWVSVHCPGATRTEFAAVAGIENKLLFKAGSASAEAVAKHAYEAMKRGKVVSIHGIGNALMAFSIRFTPRFIVRMLTKTINK